MSRKLSRLYERKTGEILHPVGLDVVLGALHGGPGGPALRDAVGDAGEGVDQGVGEEKGGAPEGPIQEPPVKEQEDTGQGD